MKADQVRNSKNEFGVATGLGENFRKYRSKLKTSEILSEFTGFYKKKCNRVL